MKVTYTANISKLKTNPMWCAYLYSERDTCMKLTGEVFCLREIFKGNKLSQFFQQKHLNSFNVQWVAMNVLP